MSAGLFAQLKRCIKYEPPPERTDIEPVFFIGTPAFYNPDRDYRVDMRYLEAQTSPPLVGPKPRASPDTPVVPPTPEQVRGFTLYFGGLPQFDDMLRRFIAHEVVSFERLDGREASLLREMLKQFAIDVHLIRLPSEEYEEPSRVIEEPPNCGTFGLRIESVAVRIPGGQRALKDGFGWADGRMYGLIQIRCGTREEFEATVRMLAQHGMVSGVDYGFADSRGKVTECEGLTYSQTECGYLDRSGFGPDPTSDAYVAPRRREMEEDQLGRLEFVVKVLRKIGISEVAIAAALAKPDHASQHAALMQILSKGGV